MKKIADITLNGKGSERMKNFIKNRDKKINELKERYDNGEFDKYFKDL